MLKKIFTGKAKSITSAAIIIGSASLASRFLGIIRDRVLASQFGVGDVLDTYYAAFRVPDMVFNLIVVGALSAGFIPIFSDLIFENKKRAWEFANNVLNILIVSLVGLSLVLLIFTPWIVKIVAPGFTGDKLQQTIILTRIMFLSPLFLGISSLFGGILQSYKRFLIYSLAPILYNVGIIFGALVFTKFWGVSGLAIGVVLGALLHLLVQLPTAEFLGFKYSFVFNVKDKDFLYLLKIMWPRVLSLAVSQINFIVITIIASTLVAGSLTVFNFAINLQSFPIGIFGISFAIAAFPSLCELANRKKYIEFSESFSNTVRQILFFIIPISILFIILRAQIVRVILGGGLFDWDATVMTANALGIFSISLFAQALSPLFTRAFFAYKNSMIPFAVGVFSATINIVLAYFLTRPFTFMGFDFNMKASGLALSFSIAMIINLLLLWIILRVKLNSLNEKKIFISLGKIFLSSLVMAVITQFMKYGVEPFFGTQTFVGVLLQAVISGLTGIGAFVLVGTYINMTELSTFLASIKKKLLKKKEFLGEEGIDVTVD